MGASDRALEHALARPLGARARPLGAYLKLLWDVKPRLLASDPAQAGGAPYLSTLGLHLDPDVMLHASAAHAAAHLVFSTGLRFDRAGLAPLTQALIGLLEDARCESLACRGLPGLRRLWAPLHRATPDDGDGVEALLGRLSRALIDPSYVDPHPWIAKGRGLFFADEGGEMLAVRQAADLRRVASRLGHDLGQMRLGFNARQYRPGPAYRDDNRWLWTPVEQELSAAPSPGGTGTPQDAADATGALTEHHLPEWDRLIGRLRPHWCRVIERPAGLLPVGPLPSAESEVARRLGASLRARRAAGARPRAAQEWGDELDLDALVDSTVRRRAGDRFAPRLYRPLPAPGQRGATLLLVDVSASTADPAGPRHAEAAIEVARRVAATLAPAMAAAGEAFAIQAFCSDTRHRVQISCVLDFDAPWDAAAAARLGGLASGGSTRLGAVLRHAAARLAARPEARRTLLVLGDGEPHDIDLHDPRYLVEDARHAVAAARRAGLRVGCLGLGPAGGEMRASIFGMLHCRTLGAAGQWPAAIAPLID